MSDNLLLKLYINGMTPAANKAMQNINNICKDYCDSYKIDLEIIDIRIYPRVAEREKILSTPVLIKESPLPTRRIIGDLSNIEQTLIELDLHNIFSKE